ncbi:MAG TPA: hypothetical protein VJH34_03510 [archaeon]|nr:hypothetical protein [archaeon]
MEAVNHHKSVENNNVGYKELAKNIADNIADEMAEKLYQKLLLVKYLPEIKAIEKGKVVGLKGKGIDKFFKKSTESK